MRCSAVNCRAILAAADERDALADARDASADERDRVLDLAEDVHVVGVIGLCLLLPLHIGAALKHHFWDRDDVVRGILPEIPDDPSHPQYGQYTRQEG